MKIVKNFKIVGVFLACVLLSCVAFTFTGCDMDLFPDNGNGQQDSQLTAEVITTTVGAVWNAIPTNVKNDSRWALFNATDLANYSIDLTYACGNDVINNVVTIRGVNDAPDSNNFSMVKFYKNKQGNLVCKMLSYSSLTYFWTFEICGDYNNLNSVTINANLKAVKYNENNTEVGIQTAQVNLDTGTLNNYTQNSSTYANAQQVEARTTDITEFINEGRAANKNYLMAADGTISKNTQNY